MVGTNEPIRRHRPQTVRSETFRRKALNLLNGISIGLRSGEYFGRYCTVAPQHQIRSFGDVCSMSALPPKAAVERTSADVSSVPTLRLMHRSSTYLYSIISLARSR